MRELKAIMAVLLGLAGLGLLTLYALHPTRTEGGLDVLGGVPYELTADLAQASAQSPRAVVLEATSGYSSLSLVAVNESDFHAWMTRHGMTYTSLDVESIRRNWSDAFGFDVPLAPKEHGPPIVQASGRFPRGASVIATFDPSANHAMIYYFRSRR